MRGAEKLRDTGWDIEPHEKAVGVIVATRKTDNSEVFFEVSEKGENGEEFVIAQVGRTPILQKGRGEASRALTELLAHVAQQGYTDIRATHVTTTGRRYWVRNGFRKIPKHPQGDYRYVSGTLA